MEDSGVARLSISVFCFLLVSLLVFLFSFSFFPPVCVFISLSVLSLCLYDVCLLYQFWFVCLMFVFLLSV